MSGLLSTPEIPAPPAPPPPPTRSDEDVQAAALRVRQRRAGARGRASTILTSGQGVRPEDEVTTTPKVLLGTA